MEVPIVANVLLWIVFLLFCSTIHELSHALAADRMGDPTPRRNGRVTLNPVAHLDPFMSFILPGLLLIASQGTFAFGGAKPVRMNPLNFRDSEKGHAIAAALGPISNFIMAAVGLGIGWGLYQIFGANIMESKSLVMITYATFLFYFINVLLGVFNLLPIPPLDGSRVVRYFLPKEGKRLFDSLEQYGIFIVFAVIFMVPGLLQTLLQPFLRMGLYFFDRQIVYMAF